MKRKRSGPQLLTRRELAGRLGMHMMNVTKLERSGLPIAERGSRGRASLYNLVDVEAWLAERERKAAEDSAQGALDPLRARAQRDQWQAKLLEQTHETRSKTLLPADEVEAAWSRVVHGSRAQLLSMPTTYADRVHRAGVLGGVRGTERALKEAVDQVLRELASPSAEAVRGNGHGAPTKRAPPRKKRPKRTKKVVRGKRPRR